MWSSGEKLHNVRANNRRNDDWHKIRDETHQGPSSECPEWSTHKYSKYNNLLSSEYICIYIWMDQKALKSCHLNIHSHLSNHLHKLTHKLSRSSTPPWTHKSHFERTFLFWYFIQALTFCVIRIDTLAMRDDFTRDDDCNAFDVENVIKPVERLGNGCLAVLCWVKLHRI